MDPDNEVADDDEEEREAEGDEEKNCLKFGTVARNGDELATAEAAVVAERSELKRKYFRIGEKCRQLCLWPSTSPCFKFFFFFFAKK